MTVDRIKRILGNRAFDYRGVTRWLVLGSAVGVVAGLGAIVFQVSLEALRLFCSESLIGVVPGHPSGEAPDFVFAQAPHFSAAWLIFLPAIGGLFAGLMIYYLAPEARGHGTDAAIEAYHRRAGKIRGRVPIIKLVATVFSMGTGGSGGREGPIAQIGAGFGSFLATRLGLGAKYRRWLLAAGLGAGVGAIFRAPLAGAIFGAEVLYSGPDVETEVLLPSLVASIVAYAVYAAKYGYGSMFVNTGHFGFSNPLELGPYLVLAFAVSLFAFLFIKMFYGVDDLFLRWRFPGWAKPVIGGLATGLTGWVLLLIVRDNKVLDVMSAGYGILGDAMGNTETIGIGLLLAVALGKIVTTSLTIGSGGSAGVFGPSMVIGGTVGAIVGQLFHQWMPTIVQHPSSFAVVGMAGFFTAAANTPLSTVIMVSEMTGNYELLVPAVWVCAFAFIFGRRWSIYRSQVTSRVHSPAHVAEYAMEIMGGTAVGKVFKRNRRFVTLPADMPAEDALKATSETRQRVFPVVNQAGELVGAFHLSELLHVIHANGSANHPLARDLLSKHPPVVSEDELVAVAHRRMTHHGADELLVTASGEPGKVIGIVTAADVLLAYNRRLANVDTDEPGAAAEAAEDGDESGGDEDDDILAIEAAEEEGMRPGPEGRPM